MKETRVLEFKSEVSSSFLKTVSAYANFTDGRILFGVDDDGRPVGLADPRQACLDIENRINDSISPKPDFTLSVNPKNGVVTLSVRHGQFTPYLYKGKAYRRSDTATIEADSIELQQLILDGQHLYFEQLACGESDLHFEYLKEMLQQKLSVSSLTDDILRTLGFFTAERKYNNAAALFADQNKFSGIDLARLGEDGNGIYDRETVSGISVLQQFNRAMAMYRRYYRYEIIEGAVRGEREQIPEKAFREAIANALVHRQWDVDAQIRVGMYRDRIEITSPGGLPSGISEEEYLNGYLSVLRNPIVGNVFFRLGLIEMFGTGVRRIRESYALLDCAPSFMITARSVTVTLPVIDALPGITPDERTVADVLSGGLVLSAAEIAVNTGFSRAKTLRLLRSLLDKRRITQCGNGRGTRYTRI